MTNTCTDQVAMDLSRRLLNIWSIDLLAQAIDCTKQMNVSVIFTKTRPPCESQAVSDFQMSSFWRHVTLTFSVCTVTIWYTCFFDLLWKVFNLLQSQYMLTKIIIYSHPVPREMRVKIKYRKNNIGFLEKD